jgi:Flp pilus assembly protein TadG
MRLCGFLTECGLKGQLDRFRRSRSGLAAVEFALIVPILVMMCAGLYDLTTAFLASQRLNMAALSIAQIATYQAANTSQPNQNILTLPQITAATSAVYVYLPDTMQASSSAFGVVLTSVVVTKKTASCTSACVYVSNVAWTGRYQGGAGPGRSCGTNAMAWVANTTPPSASTLPTSLQQPQPILVVDVYYTFRPIFYQFLTGDFVMMRSAHFSPRTGTTANWVQYYPTGSSDPTVECSGYPTSAQSP